MIKNESLPSELRAVLEIFNVDEELRIKALPYVNVERREINWYGIGRNHFGSGHSIAVAWARAIWLDRLPENLDPFERAFSMNHRLRLAVLRALAIRWGLGEQSGSLEVNY